MRPDAARGVRTELAIGAEFPHLLWIGIGVAAGGGLLLLLCSTGLLAAVRRRT